MESNSKKVSLTNREVQVADLITRGYSNKEIADTLHIKNNTVINHIRNIKSKNGVNKNTEIPGLYISYVKDKPFSLKTLREKGITALLILVNACYINNGGNF